MAAPSTVQTTVPGATTYSFGVDGNGNPIVSIPLASPPGRAGLTPQLALRHVGSSNDGIAGNFALEGAGAITRCKKTWAVNGEIAAVQFSDEDALCLNGHQLISVAPGEYRLWPDNQIKIVQVEKWEHQYFTAFYPSGDQIDFGRAPGSRPSAQGKIIAWLADKQRDARGNTIDFGYCFVEEGGDVKEFALDEIRYGSFEGDASVEATRVVSLAYGQKEHVRVSYESGLEFRQSLRLDQVKMSVHGQLVRRHELTYDHSETTGRTLLTSVQECAGSECKQPTRFHYAPTAKTSFEDMTTDVVAPSSRLASPLVGDFTGDGRPDWLVPDTVAFSTATNPVTQWRLARNTGETFAAEEVAFLQEWPMVADPQGVDNPVEIQPDLGTSVDYDHNGLNDILLNDTTGTRHSHVVLLAQGDGSFKEMDTGITRPFPLGPAPDGLRNSTGAVHLASVDHDSVVDLVQCSDQGDTLETTALSTWKVHLWRPEGFDPNGAVIETLSGIPCGIEVLPVDSNGDSVTDLIVPGFLRQGGVPIELSGTYSVHRSRADGTWVEFDTGLPTPLGGGRTVFVDVNADALPDAISGDSSGRLWTRMNTGKGFANTPNESLPWDGLLAQTKYFHLVVPGDFNGDSRMDLLMPLVDAISPDVPRWVILQAAGGRNGFTFERIESGIPFEAELGDVVKLADPRMPRVADVTGDGADDVLLYLGNQLHIFKNRIVVPDVLVGISDGANDHDPDEPAFIPNVSITYAHLQDESELYVARDDPTNGCAYPRHCVVAPMRVVKQYVLNDGNGGQRRYDLRYRDGRYDRLTGEFLGFGKRMLTDLDTGETTVDIYDTITKVQIGAREAYPFVGQIQKQWQWVPGLATQSNPQQVEMVFADRTIEVVPTNGNQSFFTLPTRMHTRRMQGSWSGAGTLEAYVTLVDTLENATMLRDSTVEISDFDEYRNVLAVEVRTEGIDAGMRITRTVTNDVDKWMLGLPDTQTECSTGSGLEQCRTITRTTTAFGEVETESTSTSDGIDDTKLFVRYERDKFGNVTRVIAEAMGHRREETTEYDDDAVFPKKRINALGQETMVEYDPGLGVLTKEMDPNGLSVEWGHDGFGRLTSEKRPDGSSTTITRTREKIDGVWRSKERTTTTGGADDEGIVDSLGRTVQTFTHGPEPKPNAPRITQRIEYDRLSGNVATKSVPTAEGTPIEQLKFDIYEFDSIGREIRHTTPWSAVTTTDYDGFRIDVTDPLKKHTITETDPLGRPVTITDAENGLTKYSYGPFDGLRTATDPGGDTTVWTRDAFGRVVRLDDPDRGTTTFVNDGFGDLVSSTDAIGRNATWEYDALGRTTKRIDTQAGKTLTTTWTWDTAPHGIGRLHSVMSPDGIKTYSYTDKGQTETVKLGVEGDIFGARWHYNDIGRVTALDYPQPLGQEPFGLTYDYDPHGFRVGVRDAATKDTYWQLTDVDAAGRYKSETFSNGTTTTRAYDDDKQTLKSIVTTHGAATIQQLSYVWDDVLNLESRTDALQSQHKTERFRYDGLQRVTCAYFSPTKNPTAPCAVSYGYAANGNLTTKSDVGAMLYLDAKHPHAVTNAAGGTYVHDAVGNQIMRPGGVSITYTPFDLPLTMQQGANIVSLGYDGDQQRIRKTTPTSETLYFEDIFEQVTNGAAREFRYYVHSPERVVAIVTRGGNDPGLEVLHVDHLGSIETITKSDGTIGEKRSYDAFGAKRHPIWGQPGGVASSKITKGFTGHEEDEEFWLVNMRGRLYDPHIARFTTPDPVIPDVFDGQSLNRFSYVWNNPLRWVDPSGFVPEDAPSMATDARNSSGMTPAEFIDYVFSPRDGQTPGDAEATGAAASTSDMGTTGASGAVQVAKEGLSSFVEGLVKGSLSDNNSWSATVGSVVGGLIPGVGLVADIRDLGAAVSHVAAGKEGAWIELGASIVGFVPGGDIAKGIAKGATKATTKAATKVGAELADDAAKVLKGSTATAADGLSGAQKTAGHVHAPRGPPAKRPGNRGHGDHQADVKGGGNRQATELARPGEQVVSEEAVRGHPGINRRADNQIVGLDGRTRVVVESERRPGGTYHKKRVKELEAAGIEVHTRPPSEWGK